MKFLNGDKEPTNAILTLALALSLPLEKAKGMAKLLLKLGASSSQADLHGCTAFHRYVARAEAEMIGTLWELDKTGVKAALNHLTMSPQHWNAQAVSPLQTAIGNNDTILVMRLLEARADAQIDFEAWLKAAKFSSKLEGRLSSYEENMKLYHSGVEQPLIVALRRCPDPQIAYQLLQAGADPNSMPPESHQMLANKLYRSYAGGDTALDLVRRQLEALRKYTDEEFTSVKPQLPERMGEYLEQFQNGTYRHWLVSNDIKSRHEVYENAMKTYTAKFQRFSGLKGVSEKKEAILEAIRQMERVERLVVEKGGKTFKDLHPDFSVAVNNTFNQPGYNNPNKGPLDKTYSLNIEFQNTTDVTDGRKTAYVEL